MLHRIIDRGTRWKGFFVVPLMALAMISMTPAQQPAKKMPIPDKEAQAKSQALIDDIFHEDFENAKTSEAKTKLAEYLYQQGKLSTDSASNRYLLYLHTQRLAAQAGNIPLAMKAIDALDQQFVIDPIRLKAATLTTASKSSISKEAGAEVARMALDLIKKAVADDDYEVANKLGDVALLAARRAKSVNLVVNVKKRIEEVEKLEQKFAKLKVYLDRIAKNPNDAEANLEMGRYFGLMKGNWKKALPLLAKGSDKALQELAKIDLKYPKKASEQVAIADGWWNLARKHDDPAQSKLKERAAYWYNKALPNLAGLNRTKAIRRIDEVMSFSQGSVIGVALGPPGKVGKIREFKGHNQEIKSLAFSPDGQFGLSGGVDQRLLLWDLKTGKQKQSFNGHTKQVWGVAFHPNGKQVVSSSWDATARLWDMHTGKEVRRFTHPVDVNGVAVSRDGKYMLVGCDDKFMQLWDIPTGNKVRRFTGANAFVYGVAFSPNGQLAAFGSLDQTARVFDRSTGRLVKQFQQNDAVYQVEFSKDSRYLFTCGDNAVHKWDLSTGKEAKNFPSPSSSMIAMALSQDGRRLVTGGNDQVVRLWDVSTGKEIKSFTGHSDQVRAVAISPDGRYALSGDYLGHIILWALPLK